MDKACILEVETGVISDVVGIYFDGDDLVYATFDEEGFAYVDASLVMPYSKLGVSPFKLGPLGTLKKLTDDNRTI